VTYAIVIQFGARVAYQLAQSAAGEFRPRSAAAWTTVSTPRRSARCGRPGQACAIRFIPGYTLFMKTAISVPDETFEQATRRATALGMSRSEFFTRAVRRYLEQLDAESLTQQIDAAVALIRDDDSAEAAVAAGRVRLTGDEDGW